MENINIQIQKFDAPYIRKIIDRISPIALISGNTVAMVQPLRNKNVTVK